MVVGLGLVGDGEAVVQCGQGRCFEAELHLVGGQGAQGGHGWPGDRLGAGVIGATVQRRNILKAYGDNIGDYQLFGHGIARVAGFDEVAQSGLGLDRALVDLGPAGDVVDVLGQDQFDRAIDVKTRRRSAGFGCSTGRVGRARRRVFLGDNVGLVADVGALVQRFLHQSRQLHGLLCTCCQGRQGPRGCARPCVITAAADNDIVQLPWNLVGDDDACARGVAAVDHSNRVSDLISRLNQRGLHGLG